MSHRKAMRKAHKEKIVKLFINKYNWEEINYQSEKNDSKNVKKNNLTIALNVLYTNKE